MNASLKGSNIFMVGIKGTGMTALAEVLKSYGANVSGSDRDEIFYTDSILKRRGIPYLEKFSKENIKSNTDMVIYSTAYSKETNPDIKAALELNLPVFSYPEMLGVLSSRSNSTGISGVHGKTTTTALTGLLVKALGINATVIAGSEIHEFGDSCALVQGERYFIAETCEYKRHFLKFNAERIVITSVEEDHLDYYRNIEDIYDAFETYGRSLPFRGALIYNNDDPGAREVALRIFKRRDDLKIIPYGISAEGDFRIVNVEEKAGEVSFMINSMVQVFKLHIPGFHNAGNATAAVAVVSSLMEEEGREITPKVQKLFADSFSSFRGGKRRSEVLGEAGGILFMDDYGHHPTEIKKTLAGIKKFYPGKRIVADFMSHTYSRTKALLSDFGRAFESADIVVLHKIYSSAREENPGDISGEDLFREVKKNHGKVKYFKEVLDADDYLKKTLSPGDLFITIGAGNNWTLGRELYGYFKNK